MHVHSDIYYTQSHYFSGGDNLRRAKPNNNKGRKPSKSKIMTYFNIYMKYMPSIK